MGIRIWYQSSTALGKNPVFEPYERAIAANARQVVRPGTVVDIHGVDVMSPHYERSEYARYLNGISITRAAARADAEGYDAIAVGCYTDPCLDEVRDTVAIPAVFMMQTSMHVACMLGRRFAFVSYSAANLRKMRALAERYGLAARLAATGRFDAELARSDEWFARPAGILDAFTREAERCVTAGADVVIPTCGVLAQVLRANGIREVAGATVLDGCSVLLTMTEAMVHLRRTVGLGGNRRSLDALVLKDIERAYGIA